MIRFGSFEIAPRTWTLTREDQPIDLSPHLVEILGHLATRSGEIVTKNELLERFWPGVNISDNTVARAVADIRKAIRRRRRSTCKRWHVVLDRMLTLTPVGPAGWIIPVDPMLAAVRYMPGRAGILAKLAPAHPDHERCPQR